MANPLGLFDKQLVTAAWFDPTLQPGGWFSTDIVMTEGEAPTGVEATAALNEAADTSAAQVSVTAHVTVGCTIRYRAESPATQVPFVRPR